MSPLVDTHAIERSIREMSTGAVLSLEAARSELGYDQLQEIDNQLQIPIGGLASTTVGWTKFALPFDVEFVFMPEQRDIPFTVPHFNWGAVVSGTPSPDPTTPDPNNPDSFVAICCQVVDWSRDRTRKVINGAIIGVGVSTLGGLDVVFGGYLHLTFQGKGAVAESVPQLDVGQ